MGHAVFSYIGLCMILRYYLVAKKMSLSGSYWGAILLQVWGKGSE